MEFARWYTQGNEDGDYYLTDWCAAGHVPAWKNVYESDGYEAEVSENMTLRALGNPEDIIALDLGVAAMKLGAGRAAKDDIIDYTAGLILNKKVGDYIKKDDTLMILHTSKKLTNLEKYTTAFKIEKKRNRLPELIYEVIS